MEDFISISTIPLPDGLNEIQKTEFSVFQEAVAELENEVAQMKAGDSIDRRTVIELLDKIKDRRSEQAEFRLRQRHEVIDKQAETDQRQIQREFEEAKTALKQRMERAYYQCSVNNQNQLKDKMGAKEYAAFIASNNVSVPPNTPDTQIQTHLQLPKEPVVHISDNEAARDVARMKEILREIV